MDGATFTVLGLLVMGVLGGVLIGWAIRREERAPQVWPSDSEGA